MYGGQKGQAGMSAAAGEDTLWIVSSGARATAPRVTARPAPADGHIHTKLSREAPNCPASAGQSWDGRHSQPFQDGGAGLGASGKAAQSKVVKRKKTGEIKLPAATRLPRSKAQAQGLQGLFPLRGKASPLCLLLPAPARGPIAACPARGALLSPLCPGAGGGSVYTFG